MEGHGPGEWIENRGRESGMTACELSPPLGALEQ